MESALNTKHELISSTELELDQLQFIIQDCRPQ